MSISSRYIRLRSVIRKRGGAAYLDADPSNIFYLTGFRAEGSYLFVSEKGMYLFVPPLLYDQARRSIPSGARVRLRVRGREGSGSLFPGRSPAGYAGFNRKISFDMHERLKGLVRPLKLRAWPDMIMDMRMIKEPSEIGALRASAALITGVMDRIRPLLRPGLTEREVAGLIDLAMVRSGATGPSFGSIVALNRHSFYPHHIASFSRLRSTGYLLIDIGCFKGGYASDLTRPLFLGKISKSWQKMYSLVKEAHLRAIEAVRPGVKAREVDRAAREVFRSQGMERYFIHNTGHGIGIDVHEPPYLSPQSDEVLQAGMVVTVEPGLYVRGRGGLRIEDMVLVTEKGAEVLTG